MHKYTLALLAIIIASCSKADNRARYNDRRNDCYKGNVKQVTVTQYEGVANVGGMWALPDSAIGTVYKYHYKQDGFLYQMEEFQLYQDTLYLISTQNVSFKDEQPEVKMTYNNEGTLIEKEMVTPTDTGYVSMIYDGENLLIKKRILVLNNQGRQDYSNITYYDPAGQAVRIIDFACVYNTTELLDSLKMRVYDGNGMHSANDDVALVPQNMEKDDKGNPTKTITVGHGAAIGSNMLVLREYEYYNE